MPMSQTVGAIAAALANAQAEMNNASKNQRNSGFNSKYADLAEIINTMREPLAKNGLSVSQLVGGFDAVTSTLQLTTILLHSSGEWIQSDMSIPVKPKFDKQTQTLQIDPQCAGSAITYARRYSLAAMIGISQEDDDGNAASGVDIGRTPPPPPQTANEPPYQPSQDLTMADLVCA
ncbi:MAG: ERF family protein, partial [Clostridia bacterium]|nr:ERF family protein [Clostridia bacterium]